MFAPVINLSTRTFSIKEISVLSKGLSFCPVLQESDLYQLKLNISDFSRLLRLREFYASNNSHVNFSVPSDDSAASKNSKPQSTFTPPFNRDKHFDSYLPTITGEIMRSASVAKTRQL